MEEIYLFSGQNGNNAPLELWRTLAGETGFGSKAFELPQTSRRSDGYREFAATERIVLEPGTHYWLRHPGARVPISLATSHSVDAGSSPGWAISGSIVSDADDVTTRVLALRTQFHGVALLGPPGPPGGVSAAAGGGEVLLSWSAPGSTGHRDVVKYQVRRKKTAEADSAYSAWADVGDGDGDGDLADERSVRVASLEEGTEYTVQVRAVNSQGDGTEAEDTATPTAADQAGTVSFDAPIRWRPRRSWRRCPTTTR